MILRGNIMYVGKRMLVGVSILLFTVVFGSTVLADIISGSSDTSASTDVTYTEVLLAKPGDAEADDTLIANISFKNGTLATITPPAGWALIRRTDNSTNIGMVTYSKRVSSLEPTSYVWNISPAVDAAGGVTRYSGVFITPVDNSSGASGFGTSLTAPSVTTTSASEQILAFFAFDNGKNNNQHFSTPVGMTEKYDFSNTPSGPSIALDDVLQVVAGVSGPKTSNITPNSPRNWVAQQIALNPATLLSVGAVSYWKFDDLTGNATDSAGTNTLTNSGTLTYSSAFINNGADHNILQYLSIDDASQTGLDLVDNFTLAGWVKFSAVPNDGDRQTMIGKFVPPNGLSYAFSYEDDTSLKGVNLQLNSSGDGFTQVQGYGIINDNIPLTIGVWYFFAVTHTGGSTTFYFQGDPVTTVINSATNIYNSNSVFTLGRENTGSANAVKGQMDEWGIWGRVLSASEISQLYNNGNGIQYPF